MGCQLENMVMTLLAFSGYCCVYDREQDDGAELGGRYMVFSCTTLDQNTFMTIDSQLLTKASLR